MRRCIFLPLAERDLGEIFDYIAGGNPDRAATFIDEIEAACRLYAEFPLSGRRRDDLASGVRCFPFGQYVIYYRPMDGGIEIIRALHGAQDIKRQF